MKQRLLSLDVLRGFDMFWILMPTYPIFHALLVAMGLGGCWLDVQMDHPEWVGFTFYDTIFPLFLFMAGVSFPYSYASSVKKGLSTGRVLLKILKRVVILYALGAWITILYNNPAWGANFKHVSVLGRIGLTWGAAAVLYVFCGWKTRFAAVAVLFAAYWAFFGQGLADQATCIPTKLDQTLFWPYLHAKQTVGLLPMVGTALFGMAAGDLLRLSDEKLPRTRKALALLAAAAAAVALGLVMAFGFGRWSLPIIKNVWTPTFALVAGGYSFAMLAFFYWMIDIRGWTGWILLFKVIGMNSIAAYVLSRTVVNFYHLKDFLFGGLMRCCATPEWGEFAGETCYMLAYWLLLYYMYRKEIFLKA